MSTDRRTADRGIRWLVRLFPSDFRESHGGEMEQVLRSQHRETAARTAAGFWRSTILDVLRAAPREHADALMQDLRYAWRGLRRAPAFSAAVLATLALGIGATTVIFTIFNSVLLRPLPYRDSSRVALVWAKDPDGARTWLSAPEIDDLARRTTSLEGVAGLTDLRLALTGAGEPEELEIVAASAALFPLLGVSPQAGRVFSDAEALETSAPVVLLSDSLWRRRFGAAAAVVGSTVQLDGRAYLVTGVLPATFGVLPPSSVFPRRVDAWVALPQHLVARARDVRYLHAIARIRDGVGLAAVQGELAGLGASLSTDYAREYAGRRWSFDVVDMQSDVLSGVRPALVVLLAVVVFVLLIACANVAALLLSRSEARRHEMAIRAALGASRARVVRQLITEGFVLASLGGACALLIAATVPRIATATALAPLPRFDDISLDWRVGVFAAIVSMVSALLFTVAPAAGLIGKRAARAQDALRTGGRSVAGHRIGRVLAAAEIALATTVLGVALVLARAFAGIVDGDPGFDPNRVMSARVTLPARYQSGLDQTQFFDAVIDRVRQIPGVRSAAAVSQVPLSGAMLGSAFLIPPGAGGDDAIRADADLRAVTPDYFQTLGIALLDGRGFSDRDSLNAPAVAVIDETMAKRLWPHARAIGQRMRWIRQPDVTIEVIGVVRGVRHRALSDEPQATVYRPMSQYARRTMFLVARTDGDPASAARPLLAAVRDVDPDQTVSQVETMRTLMARSLAQPGFGAALGGAVALLALVLATVGVYGILAYAQAQRHREVGVRLALGSTPGGIVALVLREGVSLALVGLAAGVPLAIVAARWTQARVPGIHGADAVTLFVAAAMTFGAAVAASWIPARRASRVDPAVVLRGDG
jgi:putative ABC transport system permease protein